MEDYLRKLNPAQRAAVEAVKGPIMVIAGAGSGKTRVLTYRIAHLIDHHGVDAFNILALTFTNKAAREMKERIGTIVGASEAKNLWMGTFHSVFARILRVEGERLGYPSNFTIYDTEDQAKVINNIIKEQSLDKEIYKPKSVARRISAFKNALITPEEYMRSPELREQDASARMPLMGEVFAAYNERCFRSGAMDFDDLLLNTYLLLRKFPEVLLKYQERFRFIMVDEYQDTNHAQYLIIKALANRYGNICVVGDDAQSIYAFRGANIKNILNFQRDYDDVQVYKLEQNYRSSKTIVGAANSLIAKNKDQLHKEVWTDNDQGEHIVVHKTVSDNDEGNYVARMIFEKHMNLHLPHESFAILYRTNAQSRAIEDALRRKNIPYRIYGGLSFYQRKEVKDVLAYFRLTINPQDEEAFRRVINYPKRGIGDTTIDKLTVAANREGVTIWEACQNPLLLEHAGVNRPTQTKLADFVTKVESYRVLAAKQDAFEVAGHIAKTSGLIREFSQDKTPEGVSRYENIEELLNSVKEFTDNQKEIEEGDPSLGSFMQDVALITDSDKGTPDDKNKVSLMTIHLAKGLEFPVVFIVGMEESLFPSMMSMGSRADLEEERRLFYVALTRAEKEAYLTYAQMRYRWGKLIDCEPSRFLEEIDENFLNIMTPDFSPFTGPETTSRRKPEPPKRRPQISSNRPPGPPKNLKRVQNNSSLDDGNYEALENVSVGERVKHQRFGLGTVSDLEGSGPNKKALIEFDNVGEKKLLLKFAKLERL
ncbi:MAG TPA: ATP-dependent DNA helicase [Cryomorphaceae bacterium]|nr:ATP-dependent DNA helicase [Owenweeksia sp.]HAD96265.1 ATP-dependent DNA helicase [Cryomorphaceae bacterium]HBF20576.1 ATP-dependent DNA helicase [Cryomorphaceae bacterium]HCQ17365.1 ATP-dependent DNA helicase [Cryomorphaceae bacterium]